MSQDKGLRAKALEQARLRSGIAGRIVTARHDAGLSQRGLATLVGITSAAIARFETATLPPALPSVDRIAAALAVTPMWLLFGANTPEALAEDKAAVSASKQAAAEERHTAKVKVILAKAEAVRARELEQRKADRKAKREDDARKARQARAEQGAASPL